MYSLPPSSVTHLQTAAVLPVDYTVALKPWFSKTILEQGLALLQKDEIRVFSFQRRYAGLATNEDIRAIIQMTEGKGKHRFVFRDGECSQCIGRQSGTRCKHVAALALLCLREHEDQTLPIADLFSDSPWAIIAKYLHDRSSMTTGTLQVFKKNSHWYLKSKDDTGLQLHIALSIKAATELLCLHNIDQTARLELSATDAYCSALHTLQEALSERAASPNEQILNRSGSKSKQQHLDVSLWMHLAGLLFLHLSPDQLQVRQDEEGIYHLYCPAAHETPFQLTLPRLHTWELLDKLPLLDVPQTPVRARQFSKVFFSSDGNDILVEHWCRLPTYEEYRLKDLANHRYGTRFKVDNHLFSLESIPADERLSQKKTGQLSLFSSPATNCSEDQGGFTITSGDINDFVTDNHNQLHCKRHQVAEEIVNLKIVNMPTELIIEKYTEDQDWCYLAGWYDLGNRKIQLRELLEAAADGKCLLPGPTTLQLDKSPLSWFHQLGSGRIDNGDHGERIKLRRSEFLTLAAQIGKIKNTTPPEPATLPAFLQNTDHAATVPQGRIADHLRSYQRHGTAWLYQLQQYRLGGILADDMGLGKTHQALALIDLLASEDHGSFLLVCPAAVLYHWPEKQEKFFPHLTMTVYHGPGRNLQDALNSNVVVTTYGVLQRDNELFAGIKFRLIIFDEMHSLKNSNTVTFEAASQLIAQAIIGLTGTPVENKIAELATLLSICLPELFRFKQIRQQFKQGDSPKQRRRLQRLVAPFILRRTRGQVLEELPECSEDIRLCTLSPDQVTAYRQAVDQAKGLVDSLEAGEALSDFSHILTTIIRLKQICNHLCQLEKSTAWMLYKSGKWDEFTRLVRQCMDGGLKVVVFSQFTSMLDIMEAWLTEEKIDFVGLRGSVDAKQRSKRIKRFNTVKQCRVCCASLLAGGTGIDLTGAQVVIHYDRWWNPAKEEQATARVHRMGQRHPVQVYKLVTAGTLEEKIHRLIENKRALANDLVVEDDSAVLKKLSRKELAGLFQYSG